MMTTLHTTLPFLLGRKIVLMEMKVCISITLLFSYNSSLGYPVENWKIKFCFIGSSTNF